MGRGPAALVLLYGFSGLFREHVHKLSTSEGLHDDYRNPFLGCGLQTFDPGLCVLVHVVELDLAEVPVVVIEDLEEVLGVSVV